MDPRPPAPPLPETVLAAVAAAATSVVVVDMRVQDQPIVYCNAGFEALTGYGADAVLGRNCRFLQGPDSDPAAVATLRAAIAAGRPARVEVLNYTRDGRPFWNELHLSPVHDRVGALTHFIGFQHDVTARKRAEAEVARLQTAEVERLRELDRLKDELLATVSHELRAPVHAMTGLLQLLRAGDGGPLTDAQRADLDALRGQARGLGELVDDLLDLAQLKAGRLGMRPEALDLVQVATRTAELLAHLAAAAGVRIVVEATPLVGAWADRRRVEQVVRNLVHNALKASPPGTAVVVRVRPEAGGARLEVADRGRGIDAEDQARIFERFVRIDAPGLDGGGAGLGLAISRGFVEASGGRIGVESTPRAGSTFWIWLPGLGAADLLGPRVPW